MVIGNKGLGCKGFGCHNLEDKALTLAGFAKEIWIWPQKQVADGYFLSLKFIFYFSWFFVKNFHQVFFVKFFNRMQATNAIKHQIWLLLFKDFHEKCYNPVILCIGWHNADIGRYQGALIHRFRKQCPLHRYRSISVLKYAGRYRCIVTPISIDIGVRDTVCN